MEMERGGQAIIYAQASGPLTVQALVDEMVRDGGMEERVSSLQLRGWKDADGMISVQGE